MTTPAKPRSHPTLEGQLLRLGARIRDHVAATSAEFDLTPQQAFALRALNKPASMQTLAKVMRCDASNVTGIVDRLEERGYIERQVDPQDRRVRRLAVTDTGRAARKRLEARLTERFPGTAALSAMERERLEAALTRLLETMA